MKPSLAYRTAAVVMVLFALGHTVSFPQIDPAWGVGALVASMHGIHFNIMGFNRNYWDFFVALGYSLGVFYVFSAVLAWQLGGLQSETLRSLRVTLWAFALCFAGVCVFSWIHLFVIPIAFSSVITVLLLMGAWRSGR